MDSNNKHIDFHARFADAELVAVNRCSNVPHANNFLRKEMEFEPTDIVLHVGTNYVDCGTAERVKD